MSDTFYSGPDWQVSSGPNVHRDVHESNVWPVDDNSGSGTKDSLVNANNVYDGVHPVVAVGTRLAADGRPRNVTGVVVNVEPGLTTPTARVTLNIADGMVVLNYVANVLTYAAGVPATFEQTPVIGQPVYVDDSDDLGEGVTLSMSPLNDAGIANPLAGVLWYDQDEYADAAQGGPNSSPTFDTSLANELVQQVFAVLLLNDAY